MFVFMAHSTDKKKQTGCIAKSRNPVKRIDTLNRLWRARLKGKATADKWHLDMVVGPFFRGSKRFCASWKRECRRYTIRLAYGLVRTSWLARTHRNLRVWMSHNARQTVRDMLSTDAQKYAKRLQRAITGGLTALPVVVEPYTMN